MLKIFLYNIQTEN